MNPPSDPQPHSVLASLFEAAGEGDAMDPQLWVGDCLFNPILRGVGWSPLEYLEARSEPSSVSDEVWEAIAAVACERYTQGARASLEELDTSAAVLARLLRGAKAAVGDRDLHLDLTRVAEVARPGEKPETAVCVLAFGAEKADIVMAMLSRAIYAQLPVFSHLVVDDELADELVRRLRT